MAKREIPDLDLKIKFTKELIENQLGRINSSSILDDLLKVKYGADGKVNPDTVSTSLNAFMLGILVSHELPPVFHPEHISEYQSILQKSDCFTQTSIDTEEQFDKIYDEYKKKNNMIFRGQKEAKWRLYSKLQRHWITEKLFDKDYTYQNLIENLVENGKQKHADKIKEILSANHIDTENTISVLGFLQHHSCPTPLLDWTYKFQNALFFAIDGLEQNNGTIEVEDYFSVYFIEENELEDGNIKSILKEVLSQIEEEELQKLITEIANGNEEKIKEMEAHFSGRHLFDRTKINGSGFISKATKIVNLMNHKVAYFSDKDKESGIIFSLNNSKNILNQEGVFVWNSDPTKPLELISDEFYKEEFPDDDCKYNFCHYFNINKKLEQHIRKRLQEDGITKEFIYPTPELNTYEVFEHTKENLKTSC